jgi:hypothetical protein
MACAKTLTTANGGGFVFQPAEPRRRFPHCFYCTGLLACSRWADRCDDSPMPEGSATSSVVLGKPYRRRGNLAWCGRSP